MPDFTPIIKTSSRLLPDSDLPSTKINKRTKVANLLAWLLIILVGGCFLVGLIGLLMPLFVFLLGFGLAILALHVLAWLFGRLFR